MLNFITDRSEIGEIAELYGVDRSKIAVQNLSPLHWVFALFRSERKPAAVFIEGARPITHTMTPDMARKYALREMFRSPLAGRFSSHFGGRMHPIFRQYGFHNGVDIATAHGTPVGASCEGVVTATGWMGGYGKAVIIDHPKGYRTLYGHLSSIHVRPGQRVALGHYRQSGLNRMVDGAAPAFHALAQRTADQSALGTGSARNRTFRLQALKSVPVPCKTTFRNRISKVERNRKTAERFTFSVSPGRRPRPAGIRRLSRR